MSDNEKNVNVETKEEKKPDLKLVDEKKTDEGAVKCSDCKPAPPSTIYRMLMARMTPEHLAAIGTQLIQVNGSELFWMTSVGQLYPFNAKQQAVEAEYAWLMSNPNP